MRYSSRKRGQSWSNWDNNMHVELNAESSLSSFSRPASTNEIQGLKSKSYTAPETRGQMDYIEFLAKEHGLEIGSGLEFDRHHKPTESRNSQRQSRNTFRHGLEIGSGLEFDRHHKPTESRNSQRQSRNTFRVIEFNGNSWEYIIVFNTREMTESLPNWDHWDEWE
ncbi:unnamed protein product [Oppiella nova]|uniref:Uncharacterized protein n=1 Tax=Oppiella nova TaxID=334625 RepID=A0A7R9QY25_9ACAR|nr:unnamed protein product [Oppiella nova]CAG2178540.1 unnamed protein product [Oppiella nova]